MFEECETLLKKGFEEFKIYKLLSKEDKLGQIQVEKSDTKNIDLYSSKDFCYPLKRNELNDIKLSVRNHSTLTAPIKKGQKIAEVQIILENQLIFSNKIYTINSIEPNTFGSEFQRVIKKM